MAKRIEEARVKGASNNVCRVYSTHFLPLVYFMQLLFPSLRTTSELRYGWTYFSDYFQTEHFTRKVTVVSYQNESFSSKWELPFLPPSSLELWRKERARKAALILMKNSQFDRTLRYVTFLRLEKYGQPSFLWKRSQFYRSLRYSSNWNERRVSAILRVKILAGIIFEWLEGCLFVYTYVKVE